MRSTNLLTYLLIFIRCSWACSEMVRFWSQKVKGRGHSNTKYGQVSTLGSISSPIQNAWTCFNEVMKLSHLLIIRPTWHWWWFQGHGFEGQGRDNTFSDNVLFWQRHAHCYLFICIVQCTTSCLLVCSLSVELFFFLLRTGNRFIFSCSRLKDWSLVAGIWFKIVVGTDSFM